MNGRTSLKTFPFKTNVPMETKESGTSQDDIDEGESYLPEDTESEPEPEEPASPQPKKGSRSSAKARAPQHLLEAPSPIFEEDVKAGRVQAKARKVSETDAKLAGLQQSLDELNLRDSTAIIPDKKARKAAVAHAGVDAEYVPQAGEVDTMKKKKRYVAQVYR